MCIEPGQSGSRFSGLFLVNILTQWGTHVWPIYASGRKSGENKTIVGVFSLIVVFQLNSDFKSRQGVMLCVILQTFYVKTSLRPKKVMYHHH